jgi:16S rRNA (uracil1498-N3)-methyltransferase
MHRFYIKSPDISKNVLDISDQRIIFQLTKVLRMKTGSRFNVFDESGRERAVEVLEINRHNALCNILEDVKRKTESEIEVNLYQAIPKKPALFELVIQKATEIGVSQIYPLITNRTENNRLSKFDRMQTIAIEATEQSRRTRIPVIHHSVAFNDVIEKIKNAYVAYEYEKSKNLSDYLPIIRKAKIANIFIGPEGGFEQKEIDFASENKASLFTFGPRILRTETAAISALSIILLSGR